MCGCVCTYHHPHACVLTVLIRQHAHGQFQCSNTIFANFRLLQWWVSMQAFSNTLNHNIEQQDTQQDWQDIGIIKRTSYHCCFCSSNMTVTVLNLHVDDMLPAKAVFDCLMLKLAAHTCTDRCGVSSKSRSSGNTSKSRSSGNPYAYTATTSTISLTLQADYCDPVW